MTLTARLVGVVGGGNTAGGAPMDSTVFLLDHNAQGLCVIDFVKVEAPKILHHVMNTM